MTKIYCDIADLELFKKYNTKKKVKGFTTNPSLMRKAGAKDYKKYSIKLLKVTKKPVSIEVFADDEKNMIVQAFKINQLAKNVFVKIPYTNSKGSFTGSVIKKLNKKNIKNKINYKKIKFYSFNEFYNILLKLNSLYFTIDKLTCSIFCQSLIDTKYKINNFEDPIYHLKSIKNNSEIENMRTAHIKDGVALTKFLYWIKQNKNFGFDELSLEKKLEFFRKKNKDYIYPSFNTIAGSGPNSAIIHYRSSKKTNRKIKKNDIFLCDSGGQYKYGTTDVTRTVCFKKPSEKIKNIFTRVLKGHIAVATHNLNNIRKGYLIDKKARAALNKINLDYGHGTGHGVGFFSNVHEGPQAISKFNSVELKEGMIVSNEPGYYKEGKFGIRIENLVYIEKKNNKLKFKNLTMAPIDKDLINENLLTSNEKKYLINYNLEIYNNISKFLDKNERAWLLNSIQ